MKGGVENLLVESVITGLFFHQISHDASTLSNVRKVSLRSSTSSSVKSLIASASETAMFCLARLVGELVVAHTRFCFLEGAP